jgi:hypothetical protein
LTDVKAGQERVAKRIGYKTVSCRNEAQDALDGPSDRHKQALADPAAVFETPKRFWKPAI